jgi:ribosomal protein S15P/S13E
MPDGRQLLPRIRMPRITMPGRASRAASGKTTQTKVKEAAKPGNGTQAATATATTATTAKPDAAKPAEGAKAPEPNLQERMEGLQGWMAEIERKQARITYFGGLVLLLAVGAAGVALYFGLTTHSDSATKDDLDALTNRVNSLQGAVSKNSKDTQNALNASIAQLQQSISGLQKQQAQAQANLSTLQSQVNAAALNKNATPSVTPTTPGAATTTTTPNNGKNNP